MQVYNLEVGMRKIGRRYLSKVTAKGQITLPPELRRQIGIVPGEYVEIVVGEQGNVIEVQRRRSLVQATAGIARPKGPEPADWDEIERIARADAAERIMSGLDE